MNPTKTSNYMYLMAEIATIHQTLKQHIAQKNNQPIQPETHTEIALKTATANLPSPSRLEQLCITFGLSTFEREILLLCVGMELDPAFPSLIAEAQGNPQMAYPTFSLALAALDSPYLKAISPTSPLRHYQLIDVGQGMAMTQSPLKIDESILYYLAGEDYEDRRISNIIAPLPPEISAIPICPSQSQIVAEITETWLSFGNPTNSATSENQSPIGQAENKLYPLIQLCGKTQDNNEAIATHICTTLNLKPQLLSLRQIPTLGNPSTTQSEVRSSYSIPTPLLPQ